MFKRLINILPKLLFIACALALILVAKGWKYNWDDNTFIRTGIIDIQAQPKGAQIWLDSTQQGITPNQIRGLDPGRYQLTISQDGYHPWQKWITVSPELVSQIYDVILMPTHPLLTPILESAAALIKIDTRTQKIITTSAVGAEPGFTIRNYKGNSIYESASDLLRQNQFYTLNFSPNERYLLVNTYHAKGHLTGSYLYDTNSPDEPPLDLLTQPIINQNQADLEPPTWSSSNRHLLLTTEANELIDYDPITQTPLTIIQSEQTIDLISLIPATSLFSKPRVAYLQSSQETDSYRLWLQDFPQGDAKQLEAELDLDAIRYILPSADLDNLLIAGLDSNVIVTNILSDEPQITQLTRPLEQAFAWSPDGTRLLFESTDHQLAYYDQTKNRFLYPYTLQTDETLTAACWHEDDKYIFFQTSTSSPDDERIQIKVIEKDGKNLITLLDSSSAELAAGETIDPNSPLVCADEQSLIFGTVVNQSADEFSYNLYELSLQ